MFAPPCAVGSVESTAATLGVGVDCACAAAGSASAAKADPARNQIGVRTRLSFAFRLPDGGEPYPPRTKMQDQFYYACNLENSIHTRS
jgi:hypothetical protein